MTEKLNYNDGEDITPPVSDPTEILSQAPSFEEHMQEMAKEHYNDDGYEEETPTPEPPISEEERSSQTDYLEEVGAVTPEPPISEEELKEMEEATMALGGHNAEGGPNPQDNIISEEDRNQPNDNYNAEGGGPNPQDNIISEEDRNQP